ncbi:MAG: hypothetical protein IT191_07650 [Microbacteriaceae bacterium]|nr:hypothetical protein [Microbacteriaceae bacterium]
MLLTRILTISAYLLCLAIAVGIEVAGNRNPERLAPLGHLLDEVMESRSARIGILMFWWWVGWHFLVGQTVQSIHG